MKERHRCYADDLATALTTGGADWMVLSVAAVLPILWAFTLSLHFARPYVLRFLQKLTLRFGGDVWWLSYVLTRDALLVITLVLSHDLPHAQRLPAGDGLPITAPLATLVLMWATLVKLIRRPGRQPGGLPAAEHPAGRRVGALHRPPDLRHGGRRPGAIRRRPDSP